jgi:uncharacterized protein
MPEQLTSIQKDEIARQTEEYGGVWGINHTRRLLRLVEVIGEGLEYNAEAVWLAAHLHDWGAYAPWAQKGVDHVERSVQVVESVLAEKGFPKELNALVLECIAFHHSSGSEARLEAILLRDADVLDFLGVVGVLRDFSKNPRDLRGAYITVKKRRERLPATLTLDKAKALAARRIQSMDDMLERFEGESFGLF